MLSLLLLLTGLGRLASADHHSETARLQITVPQKTGTDTDSGVLKTQVTYSIKIGGKTYNLLLEKQSFLDSRFLVYSYSKSGVLLSHSSFIKDYCFYQGHAAEIPNSVVTLSTCSGLRGLLQLENVSYAIEPLESSATSEHIVYQIKDNKIDFPPIAENYSTTQLTDKSYKILVKSEKNSDVLLKRVLRIQIIMDKALYDYMGSDVTLASEKVLFIFSLINTMYSQLQLSVILTSLEIWSDLSKISTSGDANEVLQRFVSWRENFLFRSSHDMAYLLIYRDHPNYVGATYHGMACDPKFAAGLALYPKMISLEAFSVLFTQLLGVNLGLTYNNDIYNCYCSGTACIMNPEAIRSRGVKYFSSCSMDEFKYTASRPEFECLQNQTVPEVIPQGRNASCGNGALEPPEQCDCGHIETCAYRKCCDPTTCLLIGNADCGTGPCCNKKTCQISPRGRVCRKSTDLCDFEEYCDGISEFCVPDVKSADFEFCSNKTTYCFGGKCQDTDAQCAELFGRFARGTSFLCFQEVNKHTDRFGNCNGGFCDFKDITCGKLVCQWTRTEVVPFKNFDTQYTYYQGIVCVSAYLRSAPGISLSRDYTYVATGTMCDENKYCNSGNCTDVPQRRPGSTCDSQVMCNGHGVCNTQDHCHCDVGYAPPRCEVLDSSPGGSIDNGYWILKGKTVNSLMSKQHGASQKNGLMISFYVFLPFLILGAIIAFKQNKLKIFQNKEDTVSEESLSEDSSSNISQS